VSPDPLPAAPAPPSRFGLKKGVPDGPPGPWVVLAAWGPCGFVPIAPGTAGALGAIPLFYVLRHLPLGLYFLTLVAFIALACFAAGQAGRYWKEADASPIVIDEVAGYLVTMALVPFSLGTALAGFVLFRIFDVVKPWPANAFDRVKNGFGVVMDDVAAGVWAYAALVGLRLLLRFVCTGPHWFCLELFP
jgi:phosphatidylglycerophosphatase A